jgi:hypothetical protein
MRRRRSSPGGERGTSIKFQTGRPALARPYPYLARPYAARHYAGPMAFSAGPGSVSCRTGAQARPYGLFFGPGRHGDEDGPTGRAPAWHYPSAQVTHSAVEAPAIGREGGGGAGWGAHCGRGAGMGAAQVPAVVAAPGAAGSRGSCGGADWGSDHERGPRRSRCRPPREGSGDGGPHG